MGGGRFGVPARVRDGATALGAAALLLGTGLSEEPSGAAPDVPGYALPAAGALALVARRRAPPAVLAVTGLCAAGYPAAGFGMLSVPYLAQCTARYGPGAAPSRWRHP
jgi:hypothetical protein